MTYVWVSTCEAKSSEQQYQKAREIHVLQFPESRIFASDIYFAHAEDAGSSSHVGQPFDVPNRAGTRISTEFGMSPDTPYVERRDSTTTSTLKALFLRKAFADPARAIEFSNIRLWPEVWTTT